jgi:PleD family two-component response regulator
MRALLFKRIVRHDLAPRKDPSLMTRNPQNQTHQSIKRQIEDIARKRFASQDVVNLAEFRSLKKEVHQPTVLIVDDEELMRNALKRILETSDYKVIVSDDAMGLARLLDTVHFDVILLDINLPWVNGLEICTMLKAHSAMNHVPVILVSGRKSKEDVEIAFAAGCDDFIGKPFEIDTILDVVSKSLEIAKVVK